MKKTITADMVNRVYSGVPGCACGCRGTYSSSSRSIGIILKKYADAKVVDSTPGFGDDGEIIFWDNAEGTRTYTIYLKK